jgi:HEAT repeat protein
MTQRAEVEAVRAQAATRGTIKLAALDALADVEAARPLVDALARLEHDGAAPLTEVPLLAIARDASRYLRACIAMLLSRFDADAARAALLELLGDPDPIVREAAVRALGAKGRLTRDVLTRVLADPDPRVRSAAARAVAGGTSSGEYATLDANAAMAQLTVIEKMMLIRRVPMFAELDPEDLEELSAIVEERRVDAAQIVFREGEPGDAVYLVVNGGVTVFTGGADGRPERTLSTLGAGACIGEMAVLDAEPRSATVRATERTRLLRVPGEGFKRVMSERPEMSQAIVSELVKRMRGMMAA